MKKIFLFFLVALLWSAAQPVGAATTAKPTAVWKPATPEDYKPITWAKATGIASFFKTPSGSGALDFITRIYLPNNQVQFIMASGTEPVDWGQADVNFAAAIDVKNSTPAQMTTTIADTIADTNTTTPEVAPSSSVHNFAFPRFVAETGKALATDAKFLWNGPFFNITLPVSDLSLALKRTWGNATLISSGSRPSFDMAHARRMLLVNNKTGRASISDFDDAIFVKTESGDQALEGFAPNVVKNDSANPATARLFIGVMPGNKEIVIYCSQSATVNEASNALVAAGVPVENQLEADGGGSASCGYNLPGQYFVEPSRTLPVMMGAFTVVARGVPTVDGLNVRKGPGTKYGIVVKLSKNSPIVVYEEKNGWYRIGEGQWILKTLLKKQ